MKRFLLFVLFVVVVLAAYNSLAPKAHVCAGQAKTWTNAYGQVCCAVNGALKCRAPLPVVEPVTVELNFEIKPIDWISIGVCSLHPEHPNCK